MLLALVVLYPSATARATVTTSTRSVTYSPSVTTTEFPVTFPFISKDHLKVTKTLISTGGETTLVRGTDYTVVLPVGSTQGTVTTTVGVTSSYTLTIERVVPVTQEVSFRSQGAYYPSIHEDALDKLTMIVQQIIAQGGGTSGDAAVATHEGKADPHSQYLLLSGRAGGQHAKGGTASGENLQLSSTSHATKGKVIFGAAGLTAYDEMNERLGIGTASPSVALDVTGSALLTVDLTVPELLGGSGAGDDLNLKSTSHATKGLIYLGANSAYDEANDRLGIATTAPTVELDVAGDALIGGSSPKLGLGSEYVFSGSDATDALFYVGSTAASGTTTDQSAVYLYGPNHSTYPAQAHYYANEHWFRTNDGTALNDEYVVMSATEGVAYMRDVNTAGVAGSVSAFEDCGDTLLASSDNTVITLTEITPAFGRSFVGCEVTVINTAASGTALVSVSPNGTDTITGSCVGVTGAGAATVTEFGTTAGKDAQNTKATANKGDYITLRGASDDHWYVIGCAGEWASEP